jgi:hypothetical protein
MSEEEYTIKRTRKVRGGSASGGGYGLAFLGALIYYIQHANSFGEGVLGVLKAIIWPLMLVYHLLEHLNM